MSGAAARPIATQMVLVEEILERHRAVIGADYAGYRHHVYRVLNLCLAQGPLSATDVDKLCIAAAFHDIADFSLGLFSMGIARDTIARVRREFPNAGFHWRLLRLGAAWLLRHPLNPLPMFRR